MLVITDPEKLGSLEVKAWIAHNNQDTTQLVQALIEYNISLYGFSESAAKDAVVSFIEGAKYHDIQEWERATETIAVYYDQVKTQTGLSFDVKEVASLEVGWWHLHDELEHNTDKSSLAEIFAKLYATELGLPLDSLMVAGRLKAQATVEHDLAESSSTRESEREMHWDFAKQLLVDFYKELQKVLRQ